MKILILSKILLFFSFTLWRFLYPLCLILKRRIFKLLKLNVWKKSLLLLCKKNNKIQDNFVSVVWLKVQLLRRIFLFTATSHGCMLIPAENFILLKFPRNFLILSKKSSQCSFINKQNSSAFHTEIWTRSNWNGFIRKFWAWLIDCPLRVYN